MKRILLILLPILFMTMSCDNDTEEDTNDCLAENENVIFSYTADISNPQLINFFVTYNGSHSVNSVAWEFGDGQTAASQGSALSVSHTYATEGNYSAKAEVTIEINNDNCVVEQTTNVMID